MIFSLVIIWLLSNVLCLYLAKRSHYKPGILSRFIGALLGPFAIPFIYLFKPKTQHS